MERKSTTNVKDTGWEPRMPKNDIVRSRGKYPGEAGADWDFGATARPEANEHYASQRSGLRGSDMRQGDLVDQSSNQREPVKGQPKEVQQSPHQAAQHGADVRGEPPMVQGTSVDESLPEGLRRERKGPYSATAGRNEEATQVPKNWSPKDGV